MSADTDPARTQVLQQVSAILSALLDMAHGTLPADDFAISLVVRYRHLDTGHMLIGDDEEDVLIQTLEAIKRQTGFVGSADANGDVRLVNIAPGEPLPRVCQRCVETVTDPALRQCPVCGADMVEIIRDITIRDEPDVLVLDQPVPDGVNNPIAVERGNLLALIIAAREVVDGPGGTVARDCPGMADLDEAIRRFDGVFEWELS